MLSLNNKNLKINCLLKNCTNLSLYYCINDNSHLCESCKKKYDELGFSCITNEEYQLSASYFIKYNQLIRNLYTKEDIEKYNKEMDSRNKFIFLNDENELSFGEKWFDCGISSSDPFLSVSFIGNSGSGKSSTVGSLCIDNSNHPIPGFSNSNSTSSDINSFIGETIGVEKMKYLIFDTEGLNGCLKPSSLYLKDNDKINNNNNNSEIRFKIIKKIYPMLLYIVSDVIVFTFSGNSSEKYTIIDSLYYISLVSSSVSNKTSKPHLIILFNRQSIDIEMYNDINNATNDFLKSYDNEQIQLLNNVYKSVNVLYLPNVNESNSFLVYKKQMEQLKKIISNKVIESLEYKNQNNIDISFESNMERISKLQDNFNKNPNANINLEKLGITGITNKLNSVQSVSSFEYKNSSSPNYILPSFQNNLITNYLIKRISSNYMVYFNVWYNKFLNEKYGKHDCFDYSMNKLKYALYSSYKKLKSRMNVNNRNSNEFFEQFVPVLKKLSQQLLELIPCGKMIKGNYRCINSKSTHDLHQASEMYEIKKGVFKEKIQIPHSENGSYEAKKEPEDFELYLKNVIQVYSNAKEETSTIKEVNLNLKNCFQICIGCLLEPPLLPFTCDHVLCLKCCVENKEMCSIDGCDGTLKCKKEVDFIPSMGCRILTLDGGGIRGIAECVALNIIKEELYGIEIYNLFDLIVGTSTGGIVALANVATEYSPNSIIETFEKMANSVFRANIVDHALSIVNLKSKYSRENLKNCLYDALRDKRLCDTFNKTRVAVTSVSEEQRNECIFLNYFKGVSLEDQHRFIIDATCVDAAIASSAAPTYFPPFKFDGRLFYDGGLRNNNPCKVALNEYKSLWPKKKIDVFMSIGTGKFKKKSIINSNILKLANMIIDILTECEKSWEDINKKEYMNDSENIIINENINSFRTNPLFDNEIGLDSCDVDTIKSLRSCYNSIHCSRNDLQLPIKKLLSSLFYLSNLKWNESNKTLQGCIKYRLPRMPTELVNQINSNRNLFHYYKNEKIEYIIKKYDIPIGGNSFEIPFEIQISQIDNIDILCDLSIKSGFSSSTSISGCPFSLIDSLNLYNIKIIK